MESLVATLRVSDLHLWWVAALSVLGFAVTLLALWRFAVRNRRSQIYYNPTSLNGALLTHCSTMRQYDRVPLWGFNGHVQSIYASQVRKGPTYPLRRELLTNRHGGHFAVDWLESSSGAKGIICIVPGIAGHTGNDYIKNFVHYCKEDGFNVVSYNWPGCGEHDLTYAEMCTLGDSTDLSIMFKHVRNACPELPMYGVGFSLGANLLLRYLGQVKDNTPLKCAVAMSAGYCGRSGYHLMQSNKFYSGKLVKKWKEVVVKSEDLWKDHPTVDLQKARKAETLEELDEALSAKVLQYETTEDYYADHGSIDWLEHIRIPTLLLNALDDPIIKANLVDLAKQKVPLNDNLILTTTRYGGHMGWVRSPGFWKPEAELWMDRVALEFIAAIRVELGTSL